MPHIVCTHTFRTQESNRGEELRVRCLTGGCCTLLKTADINYARCLLENLPRTCKDFVSGVRKHAGRGSFWRSIFFLSFLPQPCGGVTFERIERLGNRYMQGAPACIYSLTQTDKLLTAAWPASLCSPGTPTTSAARAAPLHTSAHIPLECAGSFADSHQGTCCPLMAHCGTGAAAGMKQSSAALLNLLARHRGPILR